MRGDFEGVFGCFLQRFVDGRTHGFGSWRDHLISWLESGLADSALYVLRFEDLKREPVSRLEAVLRFLGIETADLDLGAICRNNTVERMRAKEDLGPGAPPRRDPSYRFVNRGEVGGWANELTPAQAQQIVGAFGAEMALMAYHPSRGGQWP
jgi:hypothetical protein